MTRECDFKVTLLGTGTPIPRKDRFGQCTLISAVARIKRPGAKVDHKGHNAQKKSSTLKVLNSRLLPRFLQMRPDPRQVCAP